MADDKIVISEGDGGKSSAKLIRDVFVEAFANQSLCKMDDASEVLHNGGRLAFTTDSYVVKPLFFPGGDIGRLAVSGTVNDLATKGARPLALSSGFILEEGFSKNDLRAIVRSMNTAAEEAGVKIVTGDTKVVRRGEADGIFINTAGIGAIIDGFNVTSCSAKPGDDIIITGSIGDHGIAILNKRENLDVYPEIESDVMPLFFLIERIKEFADCIHVMRDPTRGGVATALNEIAVSSGVAIELSEQYPIKKQVKACCDMLGLDPLYLANEGKMLIFADPDYSARIIDATGLKDCAIIGKVLKAGSPGVPPVHLLTSIGSKRIIPVMDGAPLPRIC